MAQLDEVAPTGDEIEQVTLRKLVKKLGDDATKWRDAAAKTKCVFCIFQIYEKHDQQTNKKHCGQTHDIIFQFI